MMTGPFAEMALLLLIAALVGALFVKLRQPVLIAYIVDGDTYTADRRLRVATGPKLRFIRLTGHAVSELPAGTAAQRLEAAR